MKKAKSGSSVGRATGRQPGGRDFDTHSFFVILINTFIRFRESTKTTYKKAKDGSSTGRVPARHAGGCGFESHPFFVILYNKNSLYASAKAYTLYI